MLIGIVDADLLGRKKHRFPNLVCMKISRYHKQKGDTVDFILSYDAIVQGGGYDKIYLSKVFLDTKVPEWVLELDNIEYGGTGFFYDKAPNLPDDVEHTKPDYHLYDRFIELEVERGIKASEFKEYQDYSIGFITRGCFRKCSFCVNQKYDRVFKHSPLEEFVDPHRKKICLLDDNFLGCGAWKELLQELIDTNKPFKFKQGLDERLLTEEKCKMLFNSKYDGDITFAFDNIKDRELIESKLQLIKQYRNNKSVKFYVFCGFNHDAPDSYSEEFWKKDIIDVFERVKIIGKYSCLPYIMRYKDYELSPYRGIYVELARWANQPNFFKKMSFYQFCTLPYHIGKAPERYFNEFVSVYPEIAEKYFYKILYKY